MELHEAQLFRLLVGCFGEDNVLFRMSALSACGGEVPAGFRVDGIEDVGAWAKSERCLFTVVDRDDTPKLVVEFFSSYGEVIDPVELEHHERLAPLLRASGVRYVTISDDEWSDVVDPSSGVDFVSLLTAKVAPGPA